MSANSEILTTNLYMKRFKSPQTVISRFVARKTVRTAAIWAFVFGIYVVSKADGFAVAYPTASSRAKVIASFANNTGIKAILGAPPNTSSVGALSAWNTTGVMIIIGAIWALLASTRTLRGEEQSGRWELLLSGQTTARRATINVLAGLGFSLAVFYVVLAIAFIGIGSIHNIGYGVLPALYFALTVVVGTALFMAVGAVTSELMPTRARAVSAASILFGICYLIRAMADTTGAVWLQNFTPLGWVEKLQPLNGSNYIWLVPIIALTLLLCLTAIWLSGRRDLGDSTFADNDTAKPHYKLLGSPVAMAIRLTRGASIAWLIGVAIVAYAFGALTKAVVTAFNQSASLEKALKSLAHAGQVSAATSFLGVAFFLVMLLVMSYTANAVGSIREDEAEGYLDNLLVRNVARLRWLWGRVALIATVILIAGLLAGISTWASIERQHLGITFGSIMQSGLNVIAPAIFTLGVGVLFLGIRPRLTTIAAFGIIAWSFLVSMVSSGIKVNHWVQDTSVLQHVTLAPAVNPDWRSNIIMIGLGIALCVVGSVMFNSRDLEPE